jgi:hypothetical protein
MLMVMLGLKNVTQLRTLSLRRIQVEQVLTKMRRLVVLSQVLELSAKDSLR